VACGAAAAGTVGERCGMSSYRRHPAGRHRPGQIALGYYRKVTGSVKADRASSRGRRRGRTVPPLVTQRPRPSCRYIGRRPRSRFARARGEPCVGRRRLDGSRAFVAGMPLWMPAVPDGRGPTDRWRRRQPDHARALLGREDGPAFCNGDELREPVHQPRRTRSSSGRRTTSAPSRSASRGASTASVRRSTSYACSRRAQWRGCSSTQR
jgi:hypothetical protein